MHSLRHSRVPPETHRHRGSCPGRGWPLRCTLPCLRGFPSPLISFKRSGAKKWPNLSLFLTEIYDTGRQTELYHFQEDFYFQYSL